MSIKVLLKQKHLNKRKITIEEIISLFDLSYGSKDKYDCLEEDTISNVTYLYNKNRLARGISIEINDYDISLTLYLPTSLDEIDLFYRLIEKCCEYLGKKYFIKNDETYSINSIHKCIEEDTLLSKNVLNDIQSKLNKHEIDESCVFY